MNPYVSEASKLAITAFAARDKNKEFTDMLMKRTGEEDLLLALFNYYLNHIEIAARRSAGK